MAHRQITDEQQCVWDVWEVVPTLVEKAAQSDRREPRTSGRHAALGLIVPEELKNGWLAFQCEERRKRVSPIPADWREMSDMELLNLLLRAPAVARVKSRGGH
jgi:hypothetical protein